ncbi:MAG: hypothetical protein R3B38_02035 [Patescibacteria group bacterium]
MSAIQTTLNSTDVLVDLKKRTQDFLRELTSWWLKPASPELRSKKDDLYDSIVKLTRNSEFGHVTFKVSQAAFDGEDEIRAIADDLVTLAEISKQ